MKLVATTLVSLFAVVAFANTSATATATAPATGEHTATATATAPATKDAKMAPAGKVEAKAAKEDCSKMTGEAKAKCETSAKAAHK